MKLILLFLFSYTLCDFVFYTTNTRYVIGYDPDASDTAYTLTVPIYNGTTTPVIIAIAQRRTTNLLWLLDKGTVTFQGLISYDVVTGIYTPGGYFSAGFSILNSQVQGMYVASSGEAYGLYYFLKIINQRSNAQRLSNKFRLYYFLL